MLAQSNVPSNLSNDGLVASFKESASISEPTISSSKLSKVHRSFVAIFVARTERTPVFYAHLPVLIKTASLASSSMPKIRLVALPKGAETSLGRALKLPRVGLIGLLEGAPGVSELIELIRTEVLEVEVPWLETAEADRFLPIKISAIHTSKLIESKQDSHGRSSADFEETTQAVSQPIVQDSEGVTRQI